MMSGQWDSGGQGHSGASSLKTAGGKCVSFEWWFCAALPTTMMTMKAFSRNSLIAHHGGC